MYKFGERLLEERKARGWDQEDMAAAGGVAKRTYCNYEAGSRDPGAEFLRMLAEAGIDVGYIVTGIRSPTAPGQSLTPDIAESPAAYIAPGMVITNKREIALIENYRACAEEGKDATERVALVGKKAQHSEVIAHTKRNAKGGDQ